MSNGQQQKENTIMVNVEITLPLGAFKKLCEFLVSEESNIANDEEGKGDLAGLFKAICEVLPKPDLVK